MLKSTGRFLVKADAAQEQVLDSNDQERERGITILAKCTSVPYGERTINIVDTPGHADFGSEVERILTMVDGCLLLVDAVEGPMPQTRFVLRKALALHLKPIVVINKMDRPHIRPAETLDKLLDLFIELGADDDQIDFPILYAAGKAGWVSESQKIAGTDMTPLFETILKAVPGPKALGEGGLQLMVTMLDANSYLGTIGIGKIQRGAVAKAQPLVRIRADGSQSRHKVTMLQKFAGLSRRDFDRAEAGDIVLLGGVEDVRVGETVTDAEAPEALPPMDIDQPTLTMEFQVNDSPFAGKEGRFVTSRHIRERLLKEQQTNVGLKIENLPGEGHFKVSGRGELHLSVLIENMRREGYELAVSRPEVIFKTIDGQQHEPVERLLVDLPIASQGAVIEALGRRGGRMVDMAPEGSTRVRIEYLVPSRGLLGFKSELLTMTRGGGLMHHSFDGYAPKGSDPAPRQYGVLVSMEQGESTGYALSNLQERSTFLIGPGVDVYEGMIVGMNSRENDMPVNPTKAKAMSNMRSKASDEAITLSPPTILTLEQSLAFIDSSELVEITPKNLRIRKKILNSSMRKRAEKSEEGRERN